MNISEKSRKIIDSCRFCWMCRHVCPLGNATGAERNNARARMLALSIVVRGAENISECIDNVYECSLCGACTKECVTGWDPVYAIQEVKTSALLEGIVPEYVEKLLENDERAGNIYGLEMPESFKKLANNKKTDTLLYFGRDAIFKGTESLKNVVRLLDCAGVEYTTLEDEADSGAHLYFLIGKSEETRQKMVRCAEQLNKFKRVVVYDPADLKLFLREYKEWGIEISAEIIGFNKYINELIESGRLKVENSGKEYTMQDNYAVTRDLGDTETSRRIIGYCGTVKDMLLCGQDTMYAGSLVMNEYLPNAMKLVSERRWEEARRIGATCIVTESPSEYLMLLQTKPADLKLITTEEMVLENLR